MIIYKITNIETQDFYIGKTTKNITTRFSAHKSVSKRGSKSHLHRAIRKYGFENFQISILEQNISDENLLNEREIFHIQKLQPRYNMTSGGEGTSGLKRTKEHYEKVSKALKGRPLSEETKRKISESKKGKTSNRKGVKLSQETINKMIQSRKKSHIKKVNG
jgi:group I intron endonuclease